MPPVREVIVVCFGNICRSPMGEVLLQAALDARAGAGRFLVTSAGTHADDGRPPSQGTIKAMAERGVDARNLRSTTMRGSAAKGAFRILCMEQYQVDHVRAMVPHDPARVQLFGGEEVPDPMGSTQEAYDQVARQLERLIPRVVDELVKAADAEDRALR